MVNWQHVCAALGVAVLAGGIGVPRAQAQADAAAPRVRKIEFRQLPNLDLRIGNPGGGSPDWYRISIEYETSPTWLDDLSVTYYALFQPDPRDADLRSPAQFILLRGQSDYVNVKRGRHLSEMYIHPSTLERYGMIERIGVVFKSGGSFLSAASEPSSREGWWDQLSPIDGLILGRHLTPYNALSPDYYEATKAASSGAR